MASLGMSPSTQMQEGLQISETEGGGMCAHCVCLADMKHNCTVHIMSQSSHAQYINFVNLTTKGYKAPYKNQNCITQCPAQVSKPTHIPHDFTTQSSNYVFLVSSPAC